MARAPEEMTLVLGDPEMTNELEMASQARGVEKDKNKLPWKDDLVIYITLKSECVVYI